MKKISYIMMIFSFFVSTISFAKDNIRIPVVSGKFYPYDKKELIETISNYLKAAKVKSSEPPAAIISPHAGYVFSGQIMADSFKQAEGHNYDLIVLLGTNHTTPGFSKASVYSKGGYESPLGVAMVDEDASQKLINSDKIFVFEPSVHEREHSIEVLVPFVQHIFPNIKILPIVVGSFDTDLCKKIGTSIASVLKDRKPLIVASSDLSHYPDYETAVKVDIITLSAICSMNPQTFQNQINETFQKYNDKVDTLACGEAPILALMFALKDLSVYSSKLISYANSGDIPVGDRRRVVGYGAVSFIKAEKSNESSLTHDQKKVLLKIARTNIENYLISKNLMSLKECDSGLEKKQGAFVTLKKNGELRGCIGHMAEDTPLCQVVNDMAIHSAFNDYRFEPLKSDELSKIEIEISVLTPMKKISETSEIKIGRDGIVIRKNGRSAVFLPQVATEQGWNLEETLDNLCRKGGLSYGCWKQDCEFLTFQAIVFSESELR
ncbi:MAG: AmmeMemoRadiSam system protein B [Desulfobacterales bacterium]|nr:AmmeMemoRadiSam system protein B [Desulfobacterales bacterium]